MKLTQMHKTLSVILLSAVFAAGCGGGGAEIKASSTTMGQELMDLEESYNKGIISEDEYKDAKEQILERYD